MVNYEYITFDFPDDYDGRVIATLIKAQCPQPSSRAVLYIHGYIDYFFQDHLAEAFLDHGYNFYAVDLRKYGRSLLEGQHPNFAINIDEYYPDLDKSLDRISADGNSDITLLGHSTGGLLASLYAAEGAKRNKIGRMVLNSPFFSFNASKYKLNLELPMASFISLFLPFMHSKSELSDVYTLSIHKGHKGDWDFDTRLKPVEGIPLYWSWLRAIRRAQAKLKGGLNLDIPVLVMSSGRSYFGKNWSDEAMSADAVLNVKDIEKYSVAIGPDVVTYVPIEGGIHDLFLSQKDVREKAMQVMFGWLEENSR